MNKKDRNLIIVTVVLLLALIFGFVWDMNSFVLKRTLDVEITEEMSVERMRKFGMMFYRKAYEAKIHVDRSKAEQVLNYIASSVGVQPDVMDYDSFLKYADETFDKEIVKPNPIEGTEVVVIKSVTSDGDYATFMMDVESDNDAYIYIYFARG